MFPLAPRIVAGILLSTGPHKLIIMLVVYDILSLSISTVASWGVMAYSIESMGY